MSAPTSNLPPTRPSDEGGLWAVLRHRLATVKVQRSTGLYNQLARRLATRPASATSEPIWLALERRSSFAHYCPRRVEGVSEETVAEGGQSYTVLRSPTGNYLRLTPAERELWVAMDGTQNVTQLATLGFLRFKRLLPVAGLVQSLRREGFLADAPVGVYSGLRRRQAARSVEGWSQRLLGTLRSREFALGGIDRLSGGLYRAGGWLVFTRPFLAMHAVISLIGLFCFALIAAGSTPTKYTLLDGANLAGVSLNMLGLWAALLVSFLLHELAHALAVKHFGRRVLRGGVMLYYGMPAAFVDTSDIWLAGQRARIIVSLAGPLCDLFVGSVAAIAAALLPVGAMGAAAYTLAAACYLAALFNFNPLLELDGYFILVDWLRLPNLRRRALAFISAPFWQKLRARATLSSEERVFALYGLLSAVYTVVASGLALLFWQNQLVAVLGQLWREGGPIGRLLAALVVLVVVLPVGVGLVFAAWGLVRAAAVGVQQRNYGRSPLIVAVALSLLAVALAGLPLRFGLTVETGLIAPLLWLVALAAQVALHSDYRGAAVARALDSFLVVSVIELVALIGLLILPDQGPIWSACENIGFGLLLFAGFVTLLDLDLRQSPPRELVASALMMALAFVAGGLTIGVIQAAQPTVPFALLVLAAAPVYCSAMALAMLLPQVGSLRDSRLLWSWLLLWVGIAAQTPAYLLELLEQSRNTPPALAALTLAAGLWAAAWCSHFVAGRQVAAHGQGWPLEPATSEAERLQRAFQHSYAGLFRMLRQHHGSRRARALDDRMDVLAATINWGVTLDGEEARIGGELAARPLDAQGGRYAEVLRYAVATIEGLAGATFAQRAIQAAYDSLPWPEREAADRRCFPNTPWARQLSRAFGDAREARMRLLRQVELFAACDDSELHALAEALEPRRVGAGSAILSAGQIPEGLWIVEAGEIALRAGGRVVAELHRGAAFGQDVEHETSASGWVYRASVNSELLFLRSDELARLMRSAAPHAAEGPALAALVHVLERTSLFRDLPRESLRSLARQAERVTLPARSIVIRQGRVSGHLYIITVGQAAVVRRNETVDSSATPEAARATSVVARLGPDELFGELELLRGSPPMATVVSLTPLELVALPHRAVAGLLSGGGSLSLGLEQLGSGRLRHLSE